MRRLVVNQYVQHVVVAGKSHTSLLLSLHAWNDAHNLLMKSHPKQLENGTSMKKLALLGLAVAIASSTATAQTTVLSDNFNNENGGSSALNYNSFANWSVAGNVDLVKSGDFGIQCMSGLGSCVDLQGSNNGPFGRLTSNDIAFGAGDRVRITFYLSGSQRSTATDEFGFGVAFSASSYIGNFTYFGGWGYSNNPLMYPGGGGPSALYQVAGAMPWTQFGFEFDASQGGTARYNLQSVGTDNIGPMLDNVLIERFTPVPEPTTWAMMIGGLSVIGMAARRRRHS